jgi:prevent-host-death family protein
LERKRIKVSVISATEAKNRFGAIIKRAYSEEEHLIVERDGVPVVAIVPLADYARFVFLEELPVNVAETVQREKRRKNAQRRLSELLDQVHRQMPEVSEEEASRDIQKAIKAVRAKG